MSEQFDTKGLFAPKKGKEATKGLKQISQENSQTLRIYSTVALATNLLPILCSFLFNTKLNLFLIVFSVLVNAIGIGGMRYTANSGIDLNLKGGFADYLIDLIITTAACSTLSVGSNWFWLLWLWLPAYYCYKVWMTIIAPWIFAPAPEDLNPEVNEKKRKKMERKMARAGYR